MSKIKVRPLKWEQIGPQFPYTAKSIVGRYQVWDFDGKDAHFSAPGDDFGKSCGGGDIDAGKAAAQADYEARILSAIEVSE